MNRELLAGFVDLLSEPAAFVSQTGAIEAANHAFSDRFGGGQKKLSGRQLVEVVADASGLEPLIEECWTTGRTARSLIRLGHGDDAVELVAIAAAYRPSTGDPLLLVRVLPRTPTSEDVETAVDATRRAKDEFISAVSHELRSPMNAIVTWTHLLRQGSLDAAVSARALEAIERNAKLQARMLDDLHELSRGRRSQPDADRQSPVAVTLPSGASPQAQSDAGDRSGDAAPDLSGVRVLVVDDDRETRDSITALLRENRAEASNAASVREALRSLAERPPHVVVTDLLMPDLDGFSLLRMIRTIEELNEIHIPTIALTALSSEESQQRGLDSGFDVYLMKPIRPNELISIVAAAAHPHPSA